MCRKVGTQCRTKRGSRVTTENGGRVDGLGAIDGRNDAYMRVDIMRTVTSTRTDEFARLSWIAASNCVGLDHFVKVRCLPIGVYVRCMVIIALCIYRKEKPQS